MLIVYHNPRCSKSRACLQLIQEAGVPLTVIDYIKNGLTLDSLRAFVTKLGLDAIVRKNETLYKELHLAEADEVTILQALIDYPQLLQRPIAIVGEKVVVARPPEKVLELIHD
ncbi:arsenate reductase [Legionella lansingensis]|uniref:Arsenate reductase n=1 Tax=Legionella lansingensis TaxID=45067 RepID=A0A0W0VPT0_9GAMM|nr:arsenate reductase (glutaredoxin) [Legionella lansingensis]KTD22135.1 arsenate reductase [Legionella lansingensis]SNV54407.1 arsenate reductase [Legionella lansingensis]